MKRFIGVALVAGIGLGLVLWSPGCGKPSGSSDDRFELTVARNELPADGVSKTAITAIVLNADGTPTTEGVTVVLQSTGGLVEPASVAVAAGLASSSLTSDLEPGLVIISARTEPEGLRAEAQVRFTEATAARMTLSCSPNVLEANGTSEAQCTAEVLLGDGNPVANGTTVTFTTTGGSLSASSATTTNGRATVSLRSTTNGTTAIVTATSGSASDSDQVQFQDNPPGRVEVRASRSQIQANGSDQSVITATVFASRGGFVNDGTLVTCTTTAGSLSPTAPTTLDGIATTILTAATFQTNADVDCTAGSKTGRTRVRFVESTTGDVALVRVRANPSSIRNGGQTSTITITVENSSGGGLPGEDVFLSVSGPRGVTITPSEATTDSDGRVTGVLRSGVGAGVATVTAEAGSQEGTVEVTILPGPAQDMVLTVPNSINEGASSGVTALVLDAFGNPVEDGTRVSFSIVCPGGGNGGTCAGVSLTAITATTTNGSANTIVQVGNSTPEDSIELTAQVGVSPIQTKTIAIVEPTPTPVATATPTATPTPIPTP